MRVFINAATLKVGGGKSVAINFLKELSLILAETKTTMTTFLLTPHF
jgi:hypothetical protein